MKWIGLTGGIASGKSTVAKIMRKEGLPVLDADQVVHELLKPGTKAYGEVVATFGPDILGRDQGIDRRLLGQKVFGNAPLLATLESILHPEVRKSVHQERVRLQQLGVAIAIYDVPLLYEKNMVAEFDAVVCVFVTPQVQLERLKARSHLTDREIQARLQAQLPLIGKAKRANFVITNNASLEDLERKTHAVIEQLRLL
jgi:dephospho-CoA kinase